ncbi:MAG: hypothetical protein WCQ53_03635, partial [bacterium]
MQITATTKLLVLAAFSLVLFSCGDSRSVDPAAVDDGAYKLDQLRSISAVVQGLVQSDYASCTDSGSGSDLENSLIRKICAVAQSADAELQVRINDQLSSFANGLQDQIDTLSGSLASDSINTNQRIDAILATISTLTSRISDAETAISALQSAVTSISRTNYRLVRTLSDLPAPVAGVITLSANTDYEINGNINIGTNQLKLSAATQIYGLNVLNDGVTYTGTASMFTNVANASLIIRNLSITASSATKVFDFTGNSATSIYINNDYFLNCSILGTIVGGKEVWITNNESNSVTAMTGFSVSGNVTYLNFSYNVFTNTNNASIITMLQIPSGTFTTARVNYNSSLSSAGNTLLRAFDITTTPTVVDGKLTNNDATNGLLFSSSGTQILPSNTTSWWFNNNTGINNSTIYGSVWISTSVVQANTTAANTYVPVRGIFSANYNERMSYEFGLIEDVKLNPPTTATSGGNLVVAAAGAGYTAGGCITITGGGGSGSRLKLKAANCGTVGNYPNVDTTTDYLPGSGYSTGAGLVTGLSSGGTCAATAGAGCT